MTGRPLKFTVFTSTVPPRLTKVLSLGPDGVLQKSAQATMVEAEAERRVAHDLHELAEILESLLPNQAVAWGLTQFDRTPIVTQDAELIGVPGVARDRANFSFPSRTPGVMMFDHDGGRDAEELSADELRSRLFKAVPALLDAPMLWRPSVSAGVTTADGLQLSAVTRHRLYIPVTDASQIPEAGRRLEALLWASGCGWVTVGLAGQALMRTLVDCAVWQPERLDFAAPPILKSGLRRERVGPRVFGDGTALFDLARIEADEAIMKKARTAQGEARAAAKEQCAAARQKWAREAAPALAKERGTDERKVYEALMRAGQYGVLMGQFVLTAQDGQRVSVGEVLDKPDKWHGQRFHDPLGGYEHDDRIAVAYLTGGGRPTLWTHGHGGFRYDLVRQAERVETGSGLHVVATDATLAALRARGDLYDYGEGAIAHVSGGRVWPVSRDWLRDHIGRVCEFFSTRSSTDKAGQATVRETIENTPLEVCQAILAKHGERGFKSLLALVTAPTLRIDGSILDRPGFDEASSVLYATDDLRPLKVSEKPTPADALAALAFLWQPFREFPLVDDVSRGVLLHGLLSAALRATLPTVPGIGLDAPAAGTGKTLLARCVGIVAEGVEPAILPPAENDDETRKRLFAILREGRRVVLYDNVREPLGGAALDSFLTASSYSDRILGSSETVKLPNRTIFIATGNNLSLSGDTCRRIFVARLDAQIERPYTRDFNFDPAQRLLADRSRYVVAALTIVRAYIAAGRPKTSGSGKFASFEDWDGLVRQPICWLAGLVKASRRDDLPQFDDPVKAADAAIDADPETAKLAGLLVAWRALFGGRPTTVADAIKSAGVGSDFSSSLGDATATPAEALRAALEEIAGRNGASNSKAIGKWIARVEGKREGGKYFRKGALRGGVQRWAAEVATVVLAQKMVDRGATSVPKVVSAAANAEAESEALVGLMTLRGSFQAIQDSALSLPKPRRTVIDSASNTPLTPIKPTNPRRQVIDSAAIAADEALG